MTATLKQWVLLVQQNLLKYLHFLGPSAFKCCACPVPLRLDGKIMIQRIHHDSRFDSMDHAGWVEI